MTYPVFSGISTSNLSRQFTKSGSRGKIMVAAAIGAAAVATVGSAAISSSASKSAANTQAQAADNAAQLQMNEFNTIQQNEQPYEALGTSSITPLLQAMGYNVS